MMMASIPKWDEDEKKEDEVESIEEAFGLLDNMK